MLENAIGDDVSVLCTGIKTISAFNPKSHLPVAGELGAMVSHFV